MLVAILSDSHDHIVNLHRAVEAANDEGATVLIHCGDLISPFMLPILAEFKGEVHLIYGNNAGDQHLISSRCGRHFPSIRHHGVQGMIQADSLCIAFIHYPGTAKGLAATGEYDVVCCGHDHHQNIQHIESCLLINPGELLGKDDKPGFMLLNTDDRSIRRIVVGEPIRLDQNHVRKNRAK